MNVLCIEVELPSDASPDAVGSGMWHQAFDVGFQSECAGYKFHAMKPGLPFSLRDDITKQEFFFPGFLA